MTKAFVDEVKVFRTEELFVLQGCPTMQRLAAANGLVALVGSESYLMQVWESHASRHLH